MDLIEELKTKEDILDYRAGVFILSESKKRKSKFFHSLLGIGGVLGSCVLGISGFGIPALVALGVGSTVLAHGKVNDNINDIEVEKNRKIVDHANDVCRIDTSSDSLEIREKRSRKIETLKKEANKQNYSFAKSLASSRAVFGVGTVAAGVCCCLFNPAFILLNVPGIIVGSLLGKKALSKKEDAAYLEERATELIDNQNFCRISRSEKKNRDSIGQETNEEEEALRRKERIEAIRDRKLSRHVDTVDSYVERLADNGNNTKDKKIIVKQ